MRTRRLLLEPRGTVTTPLRADTLFGHLCWAMAYRDGEARLREFLETFRDGCPLYLSDGLPIMDHGGERVPLLPAPLFPLLSADQTETLRERLGLSESKADKLLLRGCLKALKQLEFIGIDVFCENRSDLTAVALTEALVELTVCPRTGAYNDSECPAGASWRMCPVFETPGQVSCHRRPATGARVPITGITADRTGGGSVSGLLYVEEREFLAHRVGVYYRLDERALGHEALRALFSDVCLGGIGKDKSAGSGAFELVAVEDVPELDETPPNANAVVSLSSSYAPMGDDPRDGFTELHVKRGKLGGHYVHHYRPWKRPVLMYRAGSVFGTSAPRPGYGSLVRDVHADAPQIAQYGAMLALSATVPGVPGG